MWPGAAFRSKLTWPAEAAVPVMPGAAARAVTASTAAHISAPTASIWRSDLLFFTACMSNLLGAGAALTDLRFGVDRGTDVDLRHHAAEVFGVIRQMIELRRVQVELLPCRVGIRGIG